MQHFVYEQFLNRFDVAGRPEKIVTIHRWELTSPNVYLLENPMLHIDISQTPVLERYIREPALAGTCCVVSSKDIGELYRTCDCIALFKNKYFFPLLDPGEYGRIDCTMV